MLWPSGPCVSFKSCGAVSRVVCLVAVAVCVEVGPGRGQFSCRGRDQLPLPVAKVSDGSWQRSAVSVETSEQKVCRLSGSYGTKRNRSPKDIG
ncbi:hypothetical protein BgiMline_036466 [Biomphalaria glabrata]|nr:hypothetical protein BgiMline_014969 [Biomphalaria glabrata]